MAKASARLPKIGNKSYMHHHVMICSFTAQEERLSGISVAGQRFLSPLAIAFLMMKVMSLLYSSTPIVYASSTFR